MRAFVYILASGRNGTLYIGVTTNLSRRLFEHTEGLVRGFTARYGVKRLVYLEAFDRIDVAIAREKQLKLWRRAWKIDLIEAANPEWRDLTEFWVGCGGASHDPACWSARTSPAKEVAMASKPLLPRHPGQRAP